MYGRDRISELPECVLTQILSYIPTKQSVQTSVLSKRGKNLYLSVPNGLDLDCSRIPHEADQTLLTFIDKLPESFLFKVGVKCRDTVIYGFMDRIGTMIDRGTQHLEIESSYCFIDLFSRKREKIGKYYLKEEEEGHRHYSPFDFMPRNLFTSTTLVYLKLTSSGIGYLGEVSMPCLKFMHLEEVAWDTHLDCLISGCPVLEELTLLRDPRDKYTALLVRTQSLKRFHLLPLKIRRSRVQCALTIDAPGLEHMSLGDDQICSIVVKNLTCVFMVEVDIKFRVRIIAGQESKRRDEITSDFLNGISSVRHLIISATTVQALDRYSQAGGMIPNFINLSRLQAVFKLLQFLPAFLECCPILKHLVLKVFHSEEGLELTDVPVPRYVSSTLECVEIQEKLLEKEEGKMKVIASYFLENSLVLKKLILSPTTPYKSRDVVESEVYNKVNKLTKRSPECEIIVRAIKED